MSNLDYVIITIASSITVLFVLECYSKLSNNKLLKLNCYNIIIILFAGIFVTLNTYTNFGYIRAIMNFIVLYVSALIIFKDSLSKGLFYTLYCYIIMLIYEILLSCLVQIYFKDISSFDTNVLFKMIFSILSMSFSLITCYIPFVNKLCNKVATKSTFNRIILVVFGISLFGLILIDFKYSMTLSNNVFIINLVIMIGILILLGINIYNYFKINKEIEKSSTLLNFMSKYEKIIEENRINKHEMLNNLLILKSFENKNSKEYNEILDELIEIYNKKGIDFKNISNLPTGLKGIFYFKLNNLEEKGFNIKINVSKKISNSLKHLPQKEYAKLYKIMGILLDNAIEGASTSKDKIINVDIYKEKNIIYIVIDNSFNGNIDIKQVNNKNYSTKGKNRGLGLYILSNILENDNYINLEQVILDNIFSSKIIIKEK